MTYSELTHRRYEPKDEQRAQELEILLSSDFENMSLEELKNISSKYNAVHKQGESISWNDQQYNAWKYMYFRIKEEENKNDCVKVGDIFHTSWGYDQTNTEYFKIVSISKTGKTCEVVQIGSETVKGSEGFMSESITPTPEIVLKDGKTCKVKIEKSTEFHPYKKQRCQIGEIILRGSVFYASSEDKHLQNLYRVDPTKSEYRSWYA